MRNSITYEAGRQWDLVTCFAIGLFFGICPAHRVTEPWDGLAAGLAASGFGASVFLLKTRIRLLYSVSSRYLDLVMVPSQRSRLGSMNGAA
jgi:hypothetical protein